MPSAAPAAPLSQTVTSSVLTAGTSAAMLAAPQIPGNITGAGGPEVELLALGLNAIAQPLKAQTWFHQNTWLIWVLLVIALTLCLIIWRDDIGRALLNAVGAVGKATQNYGTLHQVGVLGAGTD